MDDTERTLRRCLLLDVTGGFAVSLGRSESSLAYLPPAPRQTRSALAGAGVLFLAFVVLAPFAATPMPKFNGFIPAIDATIFVLDLITASLLFAHVSATRSRALCALACGYLFSAALVVAHGLTFPGPTAPPGYLGENNHSNFRIYLLWHVGLPAALLVYVWLKERDRTEGRTQVPAALLIACSVLAVSAVVGCVVWLATTGAAFLPSALTSTNVVVGRLLTALAMVICAAALAALWRSRRSTLDQWLMVVMLASIVELAITSLIGGLAPGVTLGFYSGRVCSLITASVVLTALLAETTRLNARLARANILASISEANIIGILIGNLDGHVQEANEAFLRIVGYERADVEAGRLRRTELTPAEWHERDAQAVAEMRATGSSQPYEKEYFRKDGSRVPVLVGGASFGEPRQGVVAFAVDLSDRKRAEEELAHANRVAIMGQLTASIAHEVSQPVTSLLISAEAAFRALARQAPNSDEIRPMIERVVSDGKRTAEIVKRIRNFSRKVPGRNEVLDINEAILDIVGLARIPMANNGVVLKMQLAEGLPRICGDRVQLQQVILNLTMNAIEAMSELKDGPRELSISTSRAEPDNVLVAIGDTGPGVPLGRLAQIFEAFYSTKADGLGMGLSICRSIVEAHHGRLWTAPNESCGAVFYVMLPAS
jgi:PAS domain S-box-containing protein